MIVDGTEVLYTMRNGKIVDSNIPTDGLVCYLDTRGKYNTDIYRNTLLDLSGNGNHGTLRNFSFTDGSGYENGGLKFDGVDDVLDNKYQYSSNSPHTILIDFYIPDGAIEQGANIHLPMGFYIHKYKNRIFRDATTNPYGNIFPEDFVIFTKGRYKILITYDKDFRDSTYFKKDKISKIRPSNTIDSNGTPYTFSGTGRLLNVNNGGRKTIYNVGLWDRVLTDEEITKLMEV